jgi:hypothetical protein
MAIFGHAHGVVPNRQNKMTSCRIAYILQPMTPDSPLDRSIQTELGNIVDEGQYRRDFVVAAKVAMDGDGTPNPLKKVSSCWIVCILQTITITHHLIDSSTRNWEVSLTRDDINSIPSFSATLRSRLVLPKSTKQGELLSACTHFA